MSRVRRSLVLSWIAQGALPAEHLDRALVLLGLQPDAATWRRFVERLLLIGGALGCAVAVTFFFAANWEALGRFAQFGLVGGLVVATLGAWCWLDPDSLPGRIALIAAAILLGTLLALFGQTYQTGADPWQLFATWALLILPWALVGRDGWLWLLWLMLANLAVSLYFNAWHGLFGVVFSTSAQLWTLLALNATALVAWEWAAARSERYAERWAPRLVAFGVGALLTVLMVSAIGDRKDGPVLAFVVWPAAVAAGLWFYRDRQRDLFMLAGGCLSVIIVVTTVFVRALALENAGSLLLVGLVVMGQAAWAATWLRRLAAEDAT